MLITNPVERATIPIIFASPWFQVDLADHLSSVLTSQRNRNPILFAEKKLDKHPEIETTKVAKVFSSLVKLIVRF